MVNYNNGKIYKIEPKCDHPEEDIYIGSTTKQYLCQRMIAHKYCYKLYKEGKSHYYTSFKLFDKYGFENCQIVLLENVEATNKDELTAKEKHYIENLNNINKNITGRTRKESNQAYYKNNKYNLFQKIDCACGGKYIYKNKLRHLRSLKHQNYYNINP